MAIINIKKNVIANNNISNKTKNFNKKSENTISTFMNYTVKLIFTCNKQVKN